MIQNKRLRRYNTSLLSGNRAEWYDKAVPHRPPDNSKLRQNPQDIGKDVAGEQPLHAQTAHRHQPADVPATLPDNRYKVPLSISRPAACAGYKRHKPAARQHCTYRQETGMNNGSKFPRVARPGRREHRSTLCPAKRKHTSVQRLHAADRPMHRLHRAGDKNRLPDNGQAPALSDRHREPSGRTHCLPSVRSAGHDTGSCVMHRNRYPSP